jgi:serine/threonine protein phosphatase 1
MGLVRAYLAATLSPSQIMPSLMNYSAVQLFKVNSRGRDFVVGDIHGCFDVLDTLLKRVDFNYDKDRIFSVGDLVDRGPYSAQVLDWLNKPWFHAIRGNHEQMVIECTSGIGDIPRHTRNGGAWLYELPEMARLRISEALRKLPVAIEVELAAGRKVGIVHAEVPLLEKGHGWCEAKRSIVGEANGNINVALYASLYSRRKFDNRDCTPVMGVDKVYVGHTTVVDIEVLGNVVYIDTGCSFSDGALSLVDLETGAVVAEATHR